MMDWGGSENNRSLRHKQGKTLRACFSCQNTVWYPWVAQTPTGTADMTRGLQKPHNCTGQLLDTRLNIQNTSTGAKYPFRQPRLGFSLQTKTFQSSHCCQWVYTVFSSP